MKTRDIAIESAKFFETKLVAKGATGKGLHEKVSSIENQLTPRLTSGLRKVASIRNRQLHESDAPEVDLEQFVVDALDLAFRLGALPKAAIPVGQTTQNVGATSSSWNAKQTITAGAMSASLEQAIKSDSVVTSAPEVPPMSSEPLSELPAEDRTIAEAISMLVPVLAEDELEQLIDESLTRAHAVYYPAYERWHGFVFLAKQGKSSVGERLKSLALAVAAGAELREMIELAKKLELAPCGNQ